jgi:hypothetical protein
MLFLATGTVTPDPALEGLSGAELETLNALKAESVVIAAYRSSSGPHVYLVVDAADARAALTQLARLPFVTAGFLTYEVDDVATI